MKYKYVIIFSFLLIVALVSCKQKVKEPIFLYETDMDIRNKLQYQSTPLYPNAKFAVLSDIHIYDVTLGTNGKPFEDYLDKDRKMLKESQEILDEAINDILKSGVHFLIISGDLTKDGEISSHKIVKEKLDKLVNAKINVFVVPGNHDIMNSHAVKFEEDKTNPVEMAKKEDFESIYNSFGINKAIYRDENSVSYVIEPVKGLWILALDSAKYRENTMDKDPIVSGKFYEDTLKWIEQILIKANEEEKAIMVVMHHGIVEHYEGNEKFYPEYILENYKKIGKMFAFYNVRLVFTGHYHANDITFYKYEDGKFLYDVETGSLVTAPSPYRFVSISNNNAYIKTRHIKKIPSRNDFLDYSKEYIENGLETLAKDMMNSYKVKQKDQNLLAPYVSKAFIAHYKGDESASNITEQLPSSKELGIMGKIVLLNRKNLILGIWRDLPPADNDITLNLTDGIK